MLALLPLPPHDSNKISGYVGFISVNEVIGVGVGGDIFLMIERELSYAIISHLLCEIVD